MTAVAIGGMLVEKRRSARSNLVLHIDLIDCGRAKEMEGFTDSISPDGAYVVLQGSSPREGSLINIHFKIWTGHENISRQLKARVLRSDTRGVAVGFVENDLVTFAIVQDIQHYQQYERRKELRRPEPAKLYCAM